MRPRDGLASHERAWYPGDWYTAGWRATGRTGELGRDGEWARLREGTGDVPSTKRFNESDEMMRVA
jgi:hypothetical protein